MDVYRSIIKTTKEIEALLDLAGAEGVGIHQKANSLEGEFSSDFFKKLRFVAAIRNKAVHEVDFEPDESLMRDFDSASSLILSQLRVRVDTVEAENVALSSKVASGDDSEEWRQQQHRAIREMAEYEAKPKNQPLRGRRLQKAKELRIRRYWFKNTIRSIFG